MPAPVILLVEDDASVARLLQWSFRKAGYDVRHAETIAAARQLADGDWDVMILDRVLPDGDGIDLCSELRVASPNGYIVMVTGDSSDEAKLAGFDGGADDYITKPFKLEELLARIRAGLRIVKLQKKLLEQSLTDALTSLRNRRAFDAALHSAFEHARRYRRPLSLVMIDIDHFKMINDRYGHQSGDATLRRVAKMISSGTRQTDVAARVGGEEFAILLPETPMFEALQFGEKIRSTVAAADDAPQVTVSAGIANVPHSSVTTAAQLYEAADQALYRAKATGRNRVEVERRRSERINKQSGDGVQLSTL